MATAQRISKGGKTYYRVQIRRPTKGIKVDEYFTTKREADKFIRKVDEAADKRTPIAENVNSPRRFSEAVESYLADPASNQTAKRKTLKPSTAKSRRERILWLSRECFGEIRLSKLTWELVDQKLESQSRARGWTSANNRYRYETALSRFLDFCRKQGWVAVNVVEGQDRLDEDQPRERCYTIQEWKQLLDASDDQGGMLGMFLRLAGETGCRKSELLNLRWVCVEPHEHGARLEIRNTKNDVDRAVFIGKTSYQLLRAHEQQYRKSSSALVFPSRVRNGRYAVDDPFRKARTAANLDDPDEKYGEVLTMHHIRHTWATELGAKGATLSQLMSAGGWKTSKMPMRYMKPQEAQALEAALLLSRE